MPRNTQILTVTEKNAPLNQEEFETNLLNLKDTADTAYDMAEAASAGISSHTHAISDVANLQSSLNAKANTAHSHDDRYYTETEINAMLSEKEDKTSKNSANGYAGLGSDGKIPASLIPSSASSPVTSVAGKTGAVTLGITDITSLQSSLDAKLATTGNAASAAKLAVARTISLTGGASGSASFDGSANSSIAVTVADGGHNHVISNIDNLQNELNLKLSAAGGTMTGSLISFREKQATASGTSGTITCNCSAANVFQVTPSGNISGWSFSNIPSSGQAFTMMINIIGSGTTRTVAWPSSVKWSGGVAPVLTWTSGKSNLCILTTYNGGSTWYATSLVNL